MGGHSINRELTRIKLTFLNAHWYKILRRRRNPISGRVGLQDYPSKCLEQMGFIDRFGHVRATRMRYGAEYFAKPRRTCQHDQRYCGSLGILMDGGRQLESIHVW